MADILIRLEKMPKNCRECPIAIRTRSGFNCPVASAKRGYSCRVPMGLISGIPPHCPLDELKPHGDLIDVSKIVLKYGGLAKISPYDFAGTAEYFAKQIESQPVIIPASKEDFP